MKAKIKFHYSFLIVLLAFIIKGDFKFYLLQLLILLIHELGHYLGCLLFHYEVKRFHVLPFGFYLEIINLDYQSSLKEFIITILGPLTYFISYLLISLGYKLDLISHLYYLRLTRANLVILLFNLLPFYPLDGYRILKLGLELFIKERLVNKIMTSLTLVVLCLFIYFNFAKSQFMIISFLIYNEFILIKETKERYLMYLVYKSKAKEKKVKVSKSLDLYRPYFNLIILDNKIYDQEKISNYLIKKLTKLRKTN